jgi:hypothetical protein
MDRSVPLRSGNRCLVDACRIRTPNALRPRPSARRSRPSSPELRPEEHWGPSRHEFCCRSERGTSTDDDRRQDWWGWAAELPAHMVTCPRTETGPSTDSCGRAGTGAPAPHARRAAREAARASSFSTGRFSRGWRISHTALLSGFVRRGPGLCQPAGLWVRSRASRRACAIGCSPRRRRQRTGVRRAGQPEAPGADPANGTHCAEPGRGRQRGLARRGLARPLILELT